MKGDYPMHKKRGFTLIELLVVIALTMLIFATVGGTYIFMAQSQGNLLDKSSELFYAQNIADYFTDTFANEPDQLSSQLSSNDSIDLVTDVDDKDTSHIRIYNGTLYNGQKEIFKNTNITHCIISKQDEFIICTLSFEDSNNPYTFIIGETE